MNHEVMGHNTKRLLVGAVLLGSAVAVAGCSGIGRPDMLSDGQPVTTPITAVRVDVPAGGVQRRARRGRSPQLGARTSMSPSIAPGPKPARRGSRWRSCLRPTRHTASGRC